MLDPDEQSSTEPPYVVKAGTPPEAGVSGTRNASERQDLAFRMRSTVPVSRFCRSCFYYMPGWQILCVRLHKNAHGMLNPDADDADAKGYSNKSHNFVMCDLKIRHVHWSKMA